MVERSICCLCALALWLTGCSSAPESSLVLATTTSARDSGLFDELLPEFAHETGIEVKLIAVGSGAALRMGETGEADVLVTHAPAGEKALVESGALVDHLPFMENYFVLAGPVEDPAGILGSESVVESLRRIAAADAPFVSRSDDSGTHRREVTLFREAGLDPDAHWPGLARTGAGMGQSLLVAGERRAYILSDIGTYRAFRDRIGLVVLSSNEPPLRNVYSVMRPNPERHPDKNLNVEGARRFADFLSSPAVQVQIGAFGHDADGEGLFRPLLGVAGTDPE